MSLSSEQRDRLIDLLKAGEEIDPEWARILFPPEKREYELVYYGKDREEDIIADSLAVPLQAIRAFGKNGKDWHNKLIFGDNLQAMKTLLEAKKEGKLCSADGTPGVRLVYIDPPFATKQSFSGTEDQKAYQDKVSGARFIEFMRKRLVLIRELLADEGLLVLHIDYRYGHYLKVVLDEVFPGGFRNDIKVPRGTKSVQNQFKEITALAVGDDSLLLYAKTSRTKIRHLRIALDEQAAGKWDTFWRGTDRPTMRFKIFGQKPKTGQWRWKKERAYKAKENYETYVASFSQDETLDEYYSRDLDDGVRLDFVRLNDDKVIQYYVPPRDSRIGSTLWTQIRTLGRVTSYPTEKHEQLLDRLIAWLTRPGDLVADAFAGSGTTCAVAEKLGRRWIGIDCGKLAVYTIQKRMLNLRCEIGNKGRQLNPKPFKLYNAGLYDFSTLRELSWDEWRFFALQLFQCRDEPHKIGGIQFDGYRQGASVMVFNHMDARHRDARIAEDTIQDIHGAVGSRVGSKVFVIAPALSFDFQQDYIDFDKVRYYALRIPYSIIHELYRREFTALKQPSDEMAVNDTVEAVGFDFIRTPKLKYTTGCQKPKGELFEYAVIKIGTFKSDAVVREPFKKRGNLETLSMVMLDFDYDEDTKVFDLDEVYYADALEKDGWNVRFRKDQLGKKMMAVFLDIYGNEARVLIDAAEFTNAKKRPTAKKTTAKKTSGQSAARKPPAKKAAAKKKTSRKKT